MKKAPRARQLLRFAVALLGIFGCYRFTVDSAKTGYSRLLSTVAIIQPSIEPADAAVRLTPSDPEAHYTRALALVNRQKLSDAEAELRRAIQLRPHHYYQWLDLGLTLQQLGNQDEADAALRESIRLAPAFAQPHWQLGNLLYREGRYEEAFEQLLLGAKSNPHLFEGMLDLAWVAADGDVERFEALIRPERERRHFVLARFLAKQGKAVDSVRMVQQAGRPGDENERRLLQETVSELIALGSFSEALEAWIVNHPNSGAEKGRVLNGDFVEPILTNDPGFGWQLPSTPNVLTSIDPSGPAPNTRSLRIEFLGENPPTTQLIYQLVLLAPNSRYTLSFAARTQKLVSGGPPVIVVFDADRKSSRILGQSKPVLSQSGEWAAYSADFSTTENTAGIIITVQRLACNQSPCPIFGNLWLSRFTLNKI